MGNFALVGDGALKGGNVIIVGVVNDNFGEDKLLSFREGVHNIVIGFRRGIDING